MGFSNSDVSALKANSGQFYQFQVQNDPFAYYPLALFASAEWYAQCDDFYFDASMSVGQALTYQWSCSNNDALNGLLRTKSTSTVKIFHAQLPQDSTVFQISLVVQDFAGRASSPLIRSVTRKAVAIPVMTSIGPTSYVVEPSQSVEARVSASFSSCNSASETLVFSWEQGVSSSGVLAPFIASGSILYIPPYALDAGTVRLYHNYYFANYCFLLPT